MFNQMLQDELVAAMREDRSLGCQQLNRFFHVMFDLFQQFQHKIRKFLMRDTDHQVANHGPTNLSQFRGRRTLLGTLANVQGDRKTQKGKDQVTLNIEL